ncbi:MAG TPA: FapA family protein, partial [Spirochaetota bacterium]
ISTINMIPGNSEKSPESGNFRQASMKLILFYCDTKVSKIFVETEENGVKSVSLSSPHNFFYRDEIVARIIDVEKPEDIAAKVDRGYTFYKAEQYFSIKFGDGLHYDEVSRTYRATRYGFVILDKTKSLRLIVPLQVTKDKTRAFLVVFPTKLQSIPGYKDIDEILTENKVIAPLDRKDIEQKLSEVNPLERTVHKIKIAQSKPPVNGRREYFVPLFDIEKKAGKVLSDGRIDFRQVGAIVQITKGQEVLQRFPEVKQMDGFNIYGEKVAAEMEESKGFQCGENLIPAPGNDLIYVSAIDGCLEIDKKTISVVAMVIIKGDVDFSTGNIDFNGSVQIRGAVLPGFSVKAHGDVIVGKNVDDAVIEATGSITVGMGIAGKGTTRIRAGGSLKAKYILNANIEVEGNIEAEDSIINSTIFANDKVIVTSQHGKILGGEVIARHQINVNYAGTQSETPTILTVGRNLTVERELQKIRKKMTFYKASTDEVMAKIKASFGATLFEDPKKFIAILPPVKKKACLELLAELSRNNNELKSLAMLGIRTEEKLVLDQDPVIVVPERTYLGVVINIKKRTRKIEEEIVNAKFYEDKDQKIIKFTQAV